MAIGALRLHHCTKLCRDHATDAGWARKDAYLQRIGLDSALFASYRGLGWGSCLQASLTRQSPDDGRTEERALSGVALPQAQGVARASPVAIPTCTCKGV